MRSFCERPLHGKVSIKTEIVGRRDRFKVIHSFFNDLQTEFGILDVVVVGNFVVHFLRVDVLVLQDKLLHLLSINTSMSLNKVQNLVDHSWMHVFHAVVLEFHLATQAFL